MGEFKHYIDPKKWSKILDMPYYHRVVRGFRFMESKRYKKLGHHRNNMLGRMVNITGNKLHVVRLRTLLRRLLDDDRRHEGACFYSAVMLFLLPRIKNKINFVPCDRKKEQVYTRRCCESLTFPDWAKPMLEECWALDYSFEEFLTDLKQWKSAKFDLQSALNVYRAQGDEGMFNILVQACTIYNEREGNNVRLCPELPIIMNVDVSDYVSGVYFPACVMPYFGKTKWVQTDEGFFLVNNKNEAVDCAKVGFYDCFDQPLDNRIKFLSRYEGGAAPYVVCWSWGEIVDVVGMFQGDVVVRFMGETLMNNDWHRFGPGGLIVGWLRENKLYRRRHKGSANLVVPNADFGDTFFFGATSLNGRFSTRSVDNEELMWSMYEMRDWFELGELCEEAIKRYKDS